MNIVEYKVDKKSWIVMKKLKETCIRDISNVSIIGITNKDEQFISMPKKDVIVGVGAKLLFMGAENNIEKLKKIISTSITPSYVQEQHRIKQEYQK